MASFQNSQGFLFYFSRLLSGHHSPFVLEILRRNRWREIVLVSQRERVYMRGGWTFMQCSACWALVGVYVCSMHMYMHSCKFPKNYSVYIFGQNFPSVICRLKTLFLTAFSGNITRYFARPPNLLGMLECSSSFPDP